MKKRILSMLLVLALILSFVPTVVIAEGGDHIHCLCGENITKDTVCAECGSEAVAWTAWDGATALKDLSAGNYYLTTDIVVTAVQVVQKNIAIDLCGHKITGNDNRFLYIYGATMSITDCVGTGEISGFADTTGSPPVFVTNNGAQGSTLNLYAGKITDNTCSTSNYGVISVSAGCTLNMYGGEISGNTVVRGAIKGDTTADPYSINILGGVITGNTGTGTGNTAGGAGIYSLSPVTVGGDAKIYGNTGAAGKNPDIYLRNDGSFTGALGISAEKPLEKGAQINYGLWNAETDTTDLQLISGNPTNWKNVWVSYDGQKVGYADGKFFVDNGPADADDGNYGEDVEELPGEHTHCLCGAETVWGNTCAKCGSKVFNWKAWEKNNDLPVDGGNYYLTENVTTVCTEYSSDHTAICLHGKNITSKNGYRNFSITGTAVVSITDCTENPGKITGSHKESSGGAVWIWAGGTLNMYGGKITGNTASSDGTVYVDKSDNAAVPGGVFNMYGGEISGNTARRGAGVYTASNGTNFPTVRILGGLIIGNTGTGTGATGGGAGVASFRPIEIGGDAKIFGNTAALAPNDILLRNDGTFTGALVVSATYPLMDGAQINYSLKVTETDLSDLQFISGSPENWDSSWLSYDGQKVGYQDGKFYIDTGVVPSTHIHCLCGKETTEGETCAKCDTKAVAWTGIAAMPKASAPGYYYLEADMDVAPFFAASGEFAFCLCGHRITSKEGKRIFDASGGAVISVTDCAEEMGQITGATGATTYGALMRINAGSAFNLYNGKITGNACDSSGLIYVDCGTVDTVGGTFSIYGGEISGNTCQRGTVYTALASNGKLPGKLRILGGVITGNTGTGTGNMGGGAGVYSYYPMELGGDARIYGNTAAVAPADLYIRDDQGGCIELTEEMPLSAGAKIDYGTYSRDDAEDLQFITGQPANWDNSWVTYSGAAVKYKDGVFYTAADIVISGHDHDGHSWISMTEETKLLPTKSGYYVLDGDVQLPNMVILPNDAEITICLNGHTLTAAEGARHFELRAGSSLTICDCTAKIENGQYTAGKITGGTAQAGGAIYAYAASAIYLYDGIICDNHADGNGGMLHLNAATETHEAAVFHMYGGMICGNTGAYGGAIRLQAPAEGLAGPTFRMEGGWICHNASPDLGGALHAAGGATIELLGGVIENNEATQGGGAISVNGESALTLAGAVIRNNSATTYGGGVYLQKGAVFNMESGEISGNSSKIGAGVLMVSENTTMNLSGGKISGNKAGAAGAGGVYASNKTFFNMSGGEISGNETEDMGGGLVLYLATGNLTGGKISGNRSVKAGGGIVARGAEVFLGNVIISENTASSGGGMYISRANTDTTHVTIDGAQILNNKVEGSGGGLFAYMNGNTITMKSGKITNNTANNGGGVLVQREITFTMEGGEISGNTAKSAGGGYYASIDSTFIMNGGSISGNYAATNGGGLYILRSKFQLNGGFVSYNTAKNSTGGVYINGSKGSLNGTWITNNTAVTGSGGGVGVSSTTMKVDGVSTRFNSYVAINAGLIGNNTTPKAAAGLMVIADGTVVDMYGGKISENVATKFAGGVYVNKGAAFNMHGGAICYNVSETDVAGGLRHDGGAGNHTGGEIYGNTSTRSGSGIYIGGDGNKVTFRNVKIHDNTCKVGSAIFQTAKSTLTMENCEIYDNTATQEGAAAYIYAYANFIAKDCYIHDNEAKGNGGAVWAWATSSLAFDGCKFENNRSLEGQGAAIWSRSDVIDVQNCAFRNNAAGGDGGAIYVGILGGAAYTPIPGLTLVNAVFEQNTSGAIGGAVYISDGSQETTMNNVTFTGNTAAAEAGAFWAKDELTMHDITVTGNRSGGAGYAVYLDDSYFDGHSYIAGLMQISGNVQIRDNTNGDLYLGKDTVLIAAGEGFGEDTHIDVKLHSGLLTNMVWGVYNYEGGNTEYTITYGNRSITEPEYAEPVQDSDCEMPEDPTQTPSGEEQEEKSNIGLIVGICAVMVVIAAAAVILIAASKKKKVIK